MAKSGSKKRKAGAANNHGAATAVAPTNKKIKPDSDLAIEAAPSAAEQVGMIGSILYEDEVAITTETLKLLAANPDLLPLKSLKALRVAVHDFMRVSKETSLTGTSLVSRISAALTDQRYQDALVLLAEMRIRQQRPKLGTLQRWVRETDAILTPTMSQEDQNQVWETLDAILRATQPSLIALPSSGDQGVLEEGSRVRFFPPFVIGEKREDGSKLPSHIVEAAASALQVLDVTKPEDRRPPNKYPAIIYHSPPDTFPMASLEKRGDYKSVRKDVTGVPGAFTIDDVFTADECKLLVAAAEHVGLQPDEPIAGSAVNLSSTLAHNLIWLADPSFLDRLYERIVDHLPPTIDGGAVKGINARFRLYRYRPGALYRPHVSGLSSSHLVYGTEGGDVYRSMVLGPSRH